jgi:hypothetical protein
MMYNSMYKTSGGTGTMPRLVRKQIYIESRQDALLKEKAHFLGVKEAEIVREALDRLMATIQLDVRDLTAWEREKAFIAKRMAKGFVPGTRRWKREDAYEERLMHYGKPNHG